MNRQCKRGRERGRISVAFVVLVSGLGLVMLNPGLAEETAKPAPTVPVEKAARDECARCHTCATPTAAAPCLHSCPRPHDRDMAEELAKGEVPRGVILLDMLSNVADAKDHFGPVPFDHTGHAKWAEIAGGCTICHHYTPEGGAHPACRTCHEIGFKHVDISKPGLKGAYHRQCMGCHREWSHDTKCEACHLPRIGEGKQPLDADAITPDDAMGAMHPHIPEPKVEIYETKHPQDTGSKVYFHHQRHTKTYQFKCAECHQGDSCARCHAPAGSQASVRCRGQEECHESCAACHQIEGTCDHCHRAPGQEAPAPFDHAQTGWPLNRYHAESDCRACHKSSPFAKMEHECNSCHGDWEPDTFDHAITGQVLDENHSEIDCADCHAERKFDIPPRCDECHDEDEVSFPQQRPGAVTGAEK